jgi:hypothetical protein
LLDEEVMIKDAKFKTRRIFEGQIVFDEEEQM